MVAATAALAVAVAGQAAFAVVLTDGFGDADRNNNGSITVYDTDVNLSGTLNSTPEDDDLAAKGLIEVTAAEDAGDTGIVWFSTNGFTSSNTGDPKANLKIINDNVATGVELQGDLHNSGLALGYEGKGSGSQAVGAFDQSINLGQAPGSRIVVSVDWRFWQESANPSGAPLNGELRWGLFQDTDNQFGQTNDAGLSTGGVQADVVWGADTGENDGDWRAADPGPAGDKGIWTRLPLGPDGSVVPGGSDPLDARIVYEFNDVVDGSNNKRFLEGGGVGGSGSNRDTGTVASPTGNGPGGNLTTFGPHNLRMEFRRNASGNVEVATFLDNVELLRDDIKSTDSFFPFLGPAPESFDYVAFRNTGDQGDFDFVIDNFSISNEAIPEPTSLVLLAAAGLALVGRRQR